MRHTTHHTHITDIWMDTKRRRHRRLFRVYSAHRFRRVSRAITMGHTAAQVLRWTPSDEGTNDYFAIIRPTGFAVYIGQPRVHTSQHIGPTTHPSLSMPPLPFSLHPSHRPTPHHTHNTRHTTHHTHTHHRYLGVHQATKAPPTISRLFGPSVSPCISGNQDGTHPST